LTSPFSILLLAPGARASLSVLPLLRKEEEEEDVYFAVVSTTTTTTTTTTTSSRRLFYAYLFSGACLLAA
jgi:hypothetical protein|tara:strand:- start:584 stop:793 length:210 start_codon:yes stop_codon:yes gene_type:complete